MSSMPKPGTVESYLIRMPVIALLLATAGAGAQTETPTVYAQAMVQPLPGQPGSTQPSAWNQAYSWRA